MVLIKYKNTVMPIRVICADYPNWHNGILIPYPYAQPRLPCPGAAFCSQGRCMRLSAQTPLIHTTQGPCHGTGPGPWLAQIEAAFVGWCK